MKACMSMRDEGMHGHALRGQVSATCCICAPASECNRLEVSECMSSTRTFSRNSTSSRASLPRSSRSAMTTSLSRAASRTTSLVPR
eukprot:131047-Chlamydomonas_euryale.AAC.1